MDRPKGRFGSSHRIRKRSEFRRIQAEASKAVSRSFVFLMQAAAPGQAPRLGVTASRRIGNAVRRNRAKRLVREAFRSQRDHWPEGVDVVVIVRRPIHALGLDQVIEEWRSALPRLRRGFQQLGLGARDPSRDAHCRPTPRPTDAGAAPAPDDDDSC